MKRVHSYQNRIGLVIVVMSIFFWVASTNADIKPGILRGTALDHTTRLPVINANVVVLGTDLGAATNLDGAFIIYGLKPGTYHIQVSALGYTGVIKSEVAILPGKTVEIKFLLEPSVIERKEVVVRGSFFRPSIDMPTSSRSLQYEEIRRAPGSAEDVQRAIQALPGVFSRNDQTNEIIVRGGSPYENLTVIDGIEIDNINHFPDQSTSGGPISAVNPEFLRDVTFSSGGFSARYGDRLSSVLDLELRDGNQDDFRGQLELSMAGAGANVEGGLPGGEGSYLFSFRKSYLDFLKGPIGLTAVPHYWDTQFKVTRGLSSRTYMSITGLYGRDWISIEADTPDAWSRGAESVDALGYNFAIGGRMRNVFDVGYLETVIAHCQTYYSYDVFEVKTDPATNNLNKNQIYRNRSTEITDQLHATWTSKIRDVDELSFGIKLKPLTFSHEISADPDTTIYDFNDDDIADTTVVSEEWIVEQSTTSMKYGAFLQYRWRTTEDLSFIAGLRLDGFEYSDELTLGPRFSAQWKVIPKMTLTLAYGIYHQSHPLIHYTSDPANKNLPHMRSVHYIAGLSYLLTDATQVSIEGYFKNYRNLPVSEQSLYRDVDPTFRSYRTLAIGTKEAWGLEFFAQQKLATNWYGTLAYSYGNAEASNSQETYPATFDFRHVGTLVFGYKFSGLPVRDFQRKWYGKWTMVLPVNGDELTISTRYRYVVGRPYTPRIWTDAGPELDYHWEDSSTLNNARYPDYTRWDIRWDSKWFFTSSAIVMFLEIQNLLDRPNVAEYIYADDGERDTAYQFRFFFVGGFRLEW